MATYVVFKGQKTFISECEFCKRRIKIDLPIRGKELFGILSLYEEAHENCGDRQTEED